jgi:hypothetical protein
VREKYRNIQEKYSSSHKKPSTKDEKELKRLKRQEK